MNEGKKSEQVIIYQAKNGAIEFRHNIEKETILASLNQIADLFGVQKAAVSKHLKNIFKTGELSERATVSKMETVQIEGKRKVKRSIEIYNLDAIIAVGYRVNSKQATQFRIWATNVLRDYMAKGYVINRKRIIENYDNFLRAIEDVQTLLSEHVTLNPKAVLDLVKEFADTWMSLDAYDNETLRPFGATKKSVKFTANELVRVISSFRAELIRKGGATDIFARERSQGSIEGIVGNVMQSIGGRPVYLTIEEKAAHLLYFMVKNHPFVDGNKRSGAFSFVWFLRKVRAKGAKNINPAALTALTLLIAESHPKKKNQMISLITQLL